MRPTFNSACYGHIMTDHFRNIYATQADLYDQMVSREDQRGNLFSALNDIVELAGAQVVEFGAGTGRMTRLLSFMADKIIAFDASQHMLEQARQGLIESGMTNWRLGTADNRAMPLQSAFADVVLEGWSFGHAVGWHPDDWQDQIQAMLDEMARLLRPGGTMILLETMGTGSRQPAPPTPGLAALYDWWQHELGFSYHWIRTDYQFEDIDEADRLTRFFFGDTLADQIRADNLLILPECTGIWWKTLD